MPDREKVIGHLNDCMEASRRDNTWVFVRKDIVEDAIVLLKEKEAVEPKKVKGYNPPMYTLYEYECEECKSPMMNKQPFCMGCGRAVKWDG